MTITNYHIKLYKKVGGDVDHLQRIGTSEEQTLENQSIIVAMAELVAQLKLLKTGKFSEQYRIEIEQQLNELCLDDNVISEMKKLESFK